MFLILNCRKDDSLLGVKEIIADAVISSRSYKLIKDFHHELGVSVISKDVLFKYESEMDGVEV